jgi:hypothetical protein
MLKTVVGHFKWNIYRGSSYIFSFNCSSEDELKSQNQFYLKNTFVPRNFYSCMKWEMHTPYVGAAGMLLHINGKFTIRKLKSKQEKHHLFHFNFCYCFFLYVTTLHIESNVFLSLIWLNTFWTCRAKIP